MAALIHADWTLGPISSAPPFRPEPCDPIALARFAARVRERWGLSARQAEIAYLLCAGHTRAGAIALASGMAPQTVKNHKTALFRRLGVGDMTALVMATWGEYRRAHTEA